MRDGYVTPNSYSRNEWRERQRARGLCIDCKERALKPNLRCARHLAQVLAAREKRQREVVEKRARHIYSPFARCNWLLGMTADERLAYYDAFDAYVLLRGRAELDAAYALGGGRAVEQILYEYADKSRIWSLNTPRRG